MGLGPLDGEVGTGMWEAGMVGPVSEYGERGGRTDIPPGSERGVSLSDSLFSF